MVASKKFPEKFNLKEKQTNMRYLFLFAITLLFYLGCTSSTKPTEPLIKYPSLDGTPQVIRDFSFINQDSQVVTNNTFKDKIYIANYFFTSCPTICPEITNKMLEIYDRYEKDDRVVQLSHTIDLKYDTVKRLKKHATNLEIKTDKWHMVRGKEKEIFGISRDYKVTALISPESPDGFDHDDILVLVDKNRNLRAFCHALEDGKIDEFIEKIDFLLETEYSTDKG